MALRCQWLVGWMGETHTQIVDIDFESLSHSPTPYSPETSCSGGKVAARPGHGRSVSNSDSARDFLILMIPGIASRDPAVSPCPVSVNRR